MYAFIISQMGISVTGQEDSICVPSPVFYSWMIFTGTMILYIIWRIWLLVYSQMARQGEVREVQRQNNVAFDEIHSQSSEWYETENNRTFLCVRNPARGEVRRIPMERFREEGNQVSEANSNSDSENSESSGYVMYVSRALMERWHGPIPNAE